MLQKALCLKQKLLLKGGEIEVGGEIIHEDFIFDVRTAELTPLVARLTCAQLLSQESNELGLDRRLEDTAGSARLERNPSLTVVFPIQWFLDFVALQALQHDIQSAIW